MLTRLLDFHAIKRSPIIHRSRPNIGSTSKLTLDRISRTTGNLSDIREASSELGEDRQKPDDTYRHLCTDDIQENDSDEDDIGDWDEEATLVALLDNE